jgi:hypothetical protein
MAWSAPTSRRHCGWPLRPRGGGASRIWRQASGSAQPVKLQVGRVKSRGVPCKTYPTGHGLTRDKDVAAHVRGSVTRDPSRCASPIRTAVRAAP